MSQYLCITIRFLHDRCHARGEGGVPEWPPSPLRLFQAFVAAAAAKFNEREKLVSAWPILQWLQIQHPTIVAPIGIPANTKHRLYVPDNVADKVAKSWSAGREASMSDYRTEKDVHPTNIGDNAAVHYLWPVSQHDRDAHQHFSTLQRIARAITHVGWGIDLVVGNATMLTATEQEQLAGLRWQPTNTGSLPLRVPSVEDHNSQETLPALLHRHKRFLQRIEGDHFHPVPPLSATVFDTIRYQNELEPAALRWTAFQLLKPDASGYRPFGTERYTREVVGMLRNVVARTAKDHGWQESTINVFVHGKSSDGSQRTQAAESPPRFSYFALPTIIPTLKRVESIRRVLIAAPLHCQEQINWLRRALAGQDLISESSGESKALLNILPGSDWVLRQYVEPATCWTTVTPVILSGFDDNKPLKTERLLLQAFEQAGFSRKLLDHSSLDWRKVGFFPGVELASRYVPPKNLDHRPRYHVHVQFPTPISGPIAIGAGRFRGFGVFAKLGIS